MSIRRQNSKRLLRGWCKMGFVKWAQARRVRSNLEAFQIVISRSHDSNYQGARR